MDYGASDVACTQDHDIESHAGTPRLPVRVAQHGRLETDARGPQPGAAAARDRHAAALAESVPENGLWWPHISTMSQTTSRVRGSRIDAVVEHPVYGCQAH